MTLVEIMIVIVVVALAVFGAMYGLNSITRASLRSGCLTFTAASRWAYSRAVSRGSTVRLVLDLDAETITFEEAHGRVTLARTDDARRLDLEEDEAAVDPWEAARARLNDALRPNFGASPFAQVPGDRFQTRPLARGVTIDRLTVPHEPEPRETGRGAIYFFPNGQTEHSVIWVGDGAERVFSIELHPLTGRTRVYPYAYEPDELLDDGRGGSRSETDG